MPNMLICVQMVPLAFLMHWAYSAKEYKLESLYGSNFANSSNASYSRVLQQNRAYQGGRFGIRGWMAYLNPWKIWKDGMEMRQLLTEVHIRGQTREYWGESSEDQEIQTKDANTSQTPQFDENSRSLLPS